MKTYNMWDHSSWGDNIFWTNYDERKISGHLRNLHKGDRVNSKMESGNIASFEIVDVEYMNDPSDMFFATCKFVKYI